MAQAKRKIAARAEEHYQREKAEYDEKMARRAAKEKDRGKYIITACLQGAYAAKRSRIKPKIEWFADQ